MSRPDAATGNWTRGKAVMNPKHTGAELVWNKHANKWQQPSVYASQEAERGAQMKSKGVGLRNKPDQAPPSDQDFGDERTQQTGSAFDDERTDPDAKAYDEED